MERWKDGDGRRELGDGVMGDWGQGDWGQGDWDEETGGRERVRAAAAGH